MLSDSPSQYKQRILKLSRQPPATMPMEQTFISASDLPDNDEKAADEIVTIPVDDWETRMIALANGELQSLTVRRKADRRKSQVVDGLNDAFDLIGGAARLAMWADTNPTEFYRLWSKMCPKDISTTVESSGELRVLHVLPPGPLDK